MRLIIKVLISGLISMLPLVIHQSPFGIGHSVSSAHGVTIDGGALRPVLLILDTIINYALRINFLKKWVFLNLHGVLDDVKLLSKVSLFFDDSGDVEILFNFLLALA